MTVAIIDYGLGNLRSVAGAVERLGDTPVITHDVDELARADKLILPGVGAFGDGMRNLHERGLVEPLTQLVKEEGKPVLGLCLGMQLLARESEEFGHHRGLAWLDAVVRRIPQNGLRVPHVGWNEVHRTSESRLLSGVSEEPLFYFVHSYYVQPDDAAVVTGVCEYGISMAATVEVGNVYGTQFHPEKSQRDGLTLLANFLAVA
jgi:glutamine amidotransferase